jgi:excisionase family DNA binding protein
LTVHQQQARHVAEMDRGRLAVVLGEAAPRYVSVAEAARASGLSKRAVYRAIERGELGASLVCSRLRIHPDDFLAWMEGERTNPRNTSRSRPRTDARKTPAATGLRRLIEREPAA